MVETLAGTSMEAVDRQQIPMGKAWLPPAWTAKGLTLRMAQSHHLSSSAKEMRFPLLVCFAPELADISISQLEVLLGSRPDISEDVWFRDQYQDADSPLVPVGSIIGGFIQYPHESDATKFRLKSHGVCISIDDPSGLETSRPATDLSHDRSVRCKDCF